MFSKSTYLHISLIMILVAILCGIGIYLYFYYTQWTKPDVPGGDAAMIVESNPKSADEIVRTRLEAVMNISSGDGEVGVVSEESRSAAVSASTTNSVKERLEAVMGN